MFIFPSLFNVLYSCCNEHHHHKPRITCCSVAQHNSYEKTFVQCARTTSTVLFIYRIDFFYFLHIVCGSRYVHYVHCPRLISNNNTHIVYFCLIETEFLLVLFSNTTACVRLQTVRVLFIAHSIFIY